MTAEISNQRIDLFLQTYFEVPNISEACEYSGLSNEGYEYLMSKNHWFKEAVEGINRQFEVRGLVNLNLLAESNEDVRTIFLKVYGKRRWIYRTTFEAELN